MVFYHLVGLEDVASNLVSPGDFAFFAASLASSASRFCCSSIYSLALSIFMRLGFVFVLAAFVLALDDDAGGLVQDTHGGADLVDVLAAGAACAVKIYSQVLFVDFDIDVFLEFGDTFDRGETGVCVCSGSRTG